MKVSIFHGVYLLHNLDPKIRNKSYIGYTVNPLRRIKQHNTGRDKGGAKKTSGRGTWKMILIVHGFPNDVIALRFEWAWQNPLNSRRLKEHLLIKSKSESFLEYNVRVMYKMLSLPPWHRFPLTIHWFDESYHIIPTIPIPDHINHTHGSIEYALQQEKTELDCRFLSLDDNARCSICFENLTTDKQMQFVNCPNSSCPNPLNHIDCLAKHLLDSEFSEFQQKQLVPFHGSCPSCHHKLLWADIIKSYVRKKNFQTETEQDSAQNLNDSSDLFDI